MWTSSYSDCGKSRIERSGIGHIVETMTRLHAQRHMGHVWNWFVHQTSPRQSGVEDTARAARMIVHMASPEKVTKNAQQPHPS